MEGHRASGGGGGDALTAFLRRYLAREGRRLIVHRSHIRVTGVRYTACVHGATLRSSQGFGGAVATFPLYEVQALACHWRWSQEHSEFGPPLKPGGAGRVLLLHQSRGPRAGTLHIDIVPSFDLPVDVQELSLEQRPLVGGGH